MLNEQVMSDTVSRLIEAGIDDATIVSTLVDAGLTNEEALAEIQKVKNANTAPPQNPTAQESANADDVAILRTQLATQAEAHDLHQTITTSTLEDHEDKIADISNQVAQVKESISSASGTDPSLNFKISQLEAKLDEVNAATKACLDVLQKILENNRKILTDLEAEK